MKGSRSVRGRRTLLVVLVLAVIAVAGWLVIDGPLSLRKPQHRFTIGKATTYATGPVDPDGYVDYVTALNERLSEHIKPADNANVLLWQALGPHPEDGTMPPGYFHWLGMKRPPDRGEYWIPVSRFLDEHPKLAPSKRPINKAAPDPAYQQLDDAERRPWKVNEFRWMVAWLKANAKPLALTVQATRRSQYFNPLVPSSHGTQPAGLVAALLPNVQTCRGLATALACRAMLALGEGRPDDAWQDLLACHRLGRLVARGGTVIEFLVGVALEGIVGQADVTLLASGKLDAQQIVSHLHDLQSLPPFPALADKVDLGERFMALDTAMMVQRHGVAYLYGVGVGSPADSFLERIGQAFEQFELNQANWNDVLGRINQWYDRLVAAMRINDRATRDKQLAALAQELKDARLAHHGILVLLSHEQVGEWLSYTLLSLLTPALEKIQTSSDRVEQVQSNLYLAFALAAYRQEHGRYPESLSALAPKYLSRVPLDLFSGKALIYRPRADGYLLYSVGVNGKDEEGRGYEDMPPGDDLSVRIPLAGARGKK
ncbi:MAG TPA: hypothetical protein VFA18_17640 [Gemmataceae bacterium]|nr:hypothetical protein [Gemmataceae bacterium]